MQERNKIELMFRQNTRRADLQGYVRTIKRAIETRVLSSEAGVIERRDKILERQTFGFSRDRIR